MYVLHYEWGRVARMYFIMSGVGMHVLHYEWGRDACMYFIMMQ